MPAGEGAEMTFGAIAIGIGMVVTAGAGIYEANKQAGVANSELDLQAQQNWRQQTSFNQLQALLNDPSSFFSSAPYQAAFGQGTKAVMRGAAAGGLNNTSTAIPAGGEATALQSFGQSFGAQQLLSQEQLLASMSGASFNPAGAGSVASGAYGAAGNSLGSLGGLLSFFGSSRGTTSPGGSGAWGSYGDWSLPGGGSFDGSGAAAGSYTDVLG
jgi:hypothetical protein